MSMANRERHAVVEIHTVRWWPVWLVLGVGLMLTFLVAPRLGVMPIKQIALNSDGVQVSRQKVSEAITQYVQLGLLGVELEQAQQALIDIPWVAEVRLSRQWPDTLRIDVVEQVPVARWLDGGLVGMSGDIFTPANAKLFSSLPSLVGPAERYDEVLSMYTELGRLINGAAGLNLMELTLKSNGRWHAELSNGVQLKFGKSGLVTKTQRFLKVYETSLTSKFDQVEAVDLRYEFGMAVSWRQSKTNDTASTGSEV